MTKLYQVNRYTLEFDPRMTKDAFQSPEWKKGDPIKYKYIYNKRDSTLIAPPEHEPSKERCFLINGKWVIKKIKKRTKKEKIMVKKVKNKLPLKELPQTTTLSGVFGLFSHIVVLFQGKTFSEAWTYLQSMTVDQWWYVIGPVIGYIYFMWFDEDSHHKKLTE